jgi:hypothetical protein
MIAITNTIHLVIKAQEGCPFENWIDETVGPRREKFLKRYFRRYAQSINCDLHYLGNHIYEVKPKTNA